MGVLLADFQEVLGGWLLLNGGHTLRVSIYYYFGKRYRQSSSRPAIETTAVSNNDGRESTSNILSDEARREWAEDTTLKFMGLSDHLELDNQTTTANSKEILDLSHSCTDDTRHHKLLRDVTTSDLF